ncbi:MAG: glycosyl transferase family 1 [Candidatus Epulonipiscium fishelsonii]|nr:MAG: glycosyl transferase family 1 [Epulopiscium sp. AS2M-Bin002]
MKKVLFTATVDWHITLFHLPYLEWFKNQGYEVHVATNGINEIPFCDVKHTVSFERSPFNKKNIKAYFELKNIINKEGFNVIHCHTPMGSVVTRAAALKSRTKGTLMFYTAHGFFFFKGAPLKNWLMFYPVEKIFSYFTDVLITMNKEDFNLAKRKMKAKTIKYVNGVGLDTSKFKDAEVDKYKKRQELGIPQAANIILSVGELIPRKNHETAIKAVAQLNNPNVYYIICGMGEIDQYLKKLTYKLNINRQVKFLGFRKDIAEICKVADVFLFPSLQEGLPVALMEAMAAGLPCIVSKIRGQVDLIIPKKGGLLYNPTDVNGFARGLNIMLNNKSLWPKMARFNQNKVKQFDLKNVIKEMEEIYEETMYSTFTE